MSKRSNKKNSTRNLALLSSELQGILMISGSLLLTVSLHFDAVGVLGHFFSSIFKGLFGWFSYIISYLFISYSILHLLRSKLDKRYFQKFFFIAVIVSYAMMIIATLDQTVLSFVSNLNFTEFITSSYYAGLEEQPVGLVPSIFHYWTIPLLGISGSLILWTTIALVFIIMIYPNSVSRLVGCLYTWIKNICKKRKKTTKTITKEPKNCKKNINNIKADDKINEIQVEVFSENSIDSNQLMKKADLTTIDQCNDENSNDEESKKKLCGKRFMLPNLELLKTKPVQRNKTDRKKVTEKAKMLETVLGSFGVEAKVTYVNKGPTITRYELQPSKGVKVSKIVNLSDDIALNLAASSIRIEAPIPGKAAIGIEIPNEETSLVSLEEILNSDKYKNSQASIPFAIGKNVSGDPVIFDIATAPHMLIAGATGSGKSVCINTLILSILFKQSPEKTKLLMIDPKVVELNIYNGIPHLMIPVVTDPQKATGALRWVVTEMETRYQKFAETGTRDITSYNENSLMEQIPHIVVIIDELADLMLVAAKEVEDHICRLAQMARAAGIHLIIATQRPSVDVITGIIKANIPTRLAFSVASQIDSRTILDVSGAEKLLGKGDMLFHPIGSNKPIRIQGALVTEEEVRSVVNYLKSQCEEPSYETDIIEKIESIPSKSDGASTDLLFNDALTLAYEQQQISISHLQRKFKIGYNRAARLIDEMESKGYVGPSEGTKPRKVIHGTHEIPEQDHGG
ncbi:FtsK/SpoIIIE family DNA translocase [Tindallia californiensis]|uniref:DNA translocase FtsK n=1 Tax=Tindallia californiensis TaxID=159292 RepID=A0A1H3NPR6_9FIRM|nr:DNA translocase FtsK [Tindallia californiensis]SDY90415.1 DNA translocase FtsK [Tindallia californiensis]